MEEMKKNFDALFREGMADFSNIYIFGHCNASEELAGLFLEKGYCVKGILDNNVSKHGTAYKSVPVVPPEEVMSAKGEDTIVCIAARAYAAMREQLIRMGYRGEIRKMVDYNSYAVYSLSGETIGCMQKRLRRGIRLLEEQRKKYAGYYRIYCPFSALGDVYYTMSYLPYFLQNRNIGKCVVFVVGQACEDVVGLFGSGLAEVLEQRDMDESIQAVLYTEDREAFIAHQDRPYVVNLAKALYGKKITLEMIYRCGVFGLDKDCTPCKPVRLDKPGVLGNIRKGKAVILAPYAKSVTNIPEVYWKRIIDYYTQRGYQLFTNAAQGEQALEGTREIRVKLSELQCAAEYAGTFIGIRSGVCDVIREAACRKIALYPDCCYSDTRWKMAEIYHLEDFENIVVPSAVSE